MYTWSSVFLFIMDKREIFHRCDDENSLCNSVKCIVCCALPRFLDGHRFDVAVIGVQHHRGDLIHWGRQEETWRNVTFTFTTFTPGLTLPEMKQRSNNECPSSYNGNNMSGMFTRDDDVLDVFVGAVCDVDVHFDGLTMVVHLETAPTVRESEKPSTYSLFILLTMYGVKFLFYKWVFYKHLVNELIKIWLKVENN